MEPTVWLVAGCLFEVSLPAGDGARWCLADRGPEVTLLGEQSGDGEQHFRFRAEAAGAEAGRVALRFRDAAKDAVECEVAVRIAPERWPDEGTESRRSS